jgi:hypothetical protein
MNFDYMLVDVIKFFETLLKIFVLKSNEQFLKYLRTWFSENLLVAFHFIILFVLLYFCYNW